MPLPVSEYSLPPGFELQGNQMEIPGKGKRVSKVHYFFLAVLSQKIRGLRGCGKTPKNRRKPRKTSLSRLIRNNPLVMRPWERL